MDHRKKRKKGGNQGESQKSRGTGTQMLPQVEEGIWESRVGANANPKTVGPRHRSQRRLCTQKRMNISSI